MGYQKAIMEREGVRLYAPTPKNPRYRVKGPGGESNSRRFDPSDPDAGCQAREEADRIFDAFVEWAIVEREHRSAGDTVPAAVSEAPTAAKRRISTLTVADLCDRREAALEQAWRGGRGAEGTWANAVDIHRVFIRSTLVMPANEDHPERRLHLGGKTLRDWTRDDSLFVLDYARTVRGIGTWRYADLGSALRALVTYAHTQALMPKSHDPMRGTKYSIKTATKGQAVQYVEPRLRPTTVEVEALRAAFAERCRQSAATIAKTRRGPADRSWGDLAVSFAAYSGPRPQEHAALTVDCVLNTGRGRGQVRLYQSRKQSSSHTYYGPLKGREGRWIIVPPEVWTPLVARCEQLMDTWGPEKGPSALVFPALNHRFEWVTYPPEVAAVKGKAEGWQDNDLWTRADWLRVLFRPAAKAAGWPRAYDWESLRHHFATWAHAPDPPGPVTRGPIISVEDISLLMGHATTDVTLRRYFTSSEAAIADRAAAMFAAAGDR